MDLYVLRHGLADRRSRVKYPDDSERPLTRKGVRRLRRQVRGMNAIRLRPELVVSSPLVRAMQTAEVVLEGVRGVGPLEVSEALAPWSDPRDILMELDDEKGPDLRSVMVVGHEPHLSRLVSLVATGSDDSIIRLKKGTLCRLRTHPLAFDGRRGRIEWSMTPRQMARLG